MGNRGALKPRHYELPRPFAAKHWITCVLKDQNNQPLPKANIKYTRLFFLDEVTAFAAGHRPCGGCQRKRYSQFVEFWCKANQRDKDELDQVLHAERTETETVGSIHDHTAKLSELPNGTFVRLENALQPHLLLLGQLFPWTVQGYLAPIRLSESTVVQVVTPLSIVKTLLAGFPLPLTSEVTVHPSARQHLD